MDAVETLREASWRARDRAEAATPGPWDSNTRTDSGKTLVCHGLTCIVGTHHRADAEHIASWHPKVAIAASMVWHEVAYQIAENDLPENDPIAAEAIEAARAFLGEVSS